MIFKFHFSENTLSLRSIMYNVFSVCRPVLYHITLPENKFRNYDNFKNNTHTIRLIMFFPSLIRIHLIRAIVVGSV